MKTETIPAYLLPEVVIFWRGSYLTFGGQLAVRVGRRSVQFRAGEQLVEMRRAALRNDPVLGALLRPSLANLALAGNAAEVAAARLGDSSLLESVTGTVATVLAVLANAPENAPRLPSFETLRDDIQRLRCQLVEHVEQRLVSPPREDEDLGAVIDEACAALEAAALKVPAMRVVSLDEGGSRRLKVPVVAGSDYCPEIQNRVISAPVGPERVSVLGGAVSIEIEGSDDPHVRSLEIRGEQFSRRFVFPLSKRDEASLELLSLCIFATTIVEGFGRFEEHASLTDAVVPALAAGLGAVAKLGNDGKSRDRLRGALGEIARAVTKSLAGERSRRLAVQYPSVDGALAAIGATLSSLPGAERAASATTS